MNRLMIVSLLGIATALGGCVNPPPKPNDPYYAPVLPRTPLPAAQNNGAIYQAGFEQNLYDDRKAFRVGDIITITLNEKTQASKKANSDIQKDSKTKMACRPAGLMKSAVWMLPITCGWALPVVVTETVPSWP
ncbi:flagellar basal body L-ring protein FlgH, partial [Pseudomonas aeruginosa]|uniref:flagellar basal body L-ring protein FlgH n=1 Tax=Pseudomonas aeruginosa TaxID=287 RepID=UPI0022376A16